MTNNPPNANATRMNAVGITARPNSNARKTMPMGNAMNHAVSERVNMTRGVKTSARYAPSKNAVTSHATTNGAPAPSKLPAGLLASFV